MSAIDLLVGSVETVLTTFQSQLSDAHFGRIRAIIQKSEASGRIEKVMMRENISLDAYVQRVVETFGEEQAYVQALRQQRDETTSWPRRKQ